MGRKLRYLGLSGRAEIERLHNGGAPQFLALERNSQGGWEAVSAGRGGRRRGAGKRSRQRRRLRN